MNLSPTNLEWLASFWGVFPWPPYVGANNWQISQETEEMGLEKRHPQKKSWVSHQTLCREGWPIGFRSLWTAMWVWGPWNAGWSDVRIWGTAPNAAAKRGEEPPALGGLCYGRLSGNQCPIRVEFLVRKFEEELRVGKNVQVFTALLASGLADKVGEEDNKLETLNAILQSCGGSKLTWFKIWTLVTNPDYDAKRWNPCENKNKEDVVMIDKWGIDNLP